MIVATAGHVDHGKTLLLKSLTGVDTDRLPEEKQRGLSIDLGFAYSDLGDGYSLGFVDVPGHERFVRNMLAGVAGIDFALLVVAADDGPMPQTLEHLAILDLLGVNRGAVALSKIDRVTPERVDQVANEVSALIQNSSLVGACVFPLSSLTGLGIDKLRDYLEAATRQTGGRDTAGNFRLAVDRCFTVTGAGIVVTGSVFSGRIAVGDQLVLSPRGTRVRVRAIHAQDQPSQSGAAGQRCALNIAGPDLDKSQINRGDWLLDERIHMPTDRFDASLRVQASETDALQHWTPAHLYLGAADVTCRIAVLQGGVLPPASSGLVQLVLDRPIGAVRGDRFILRDQSARRTIAGGIVIDPFSPSRGRAAPRRIGWLQAMSQEIPEEAVGQLLEQSPAGLDLDRFARAWNLTAEEADQLFAVLPLKRIDDGTRSWGFAPQHWQAYMESLLSAVANWHRQKPDSLGPHDYELGRIIAVKVSVALLRQAIKDLVKDGQLARKGSIVHIPAHSPRPGADDLKLWEKVEPLIRDGGLRPPIVRELAADLDIELRTLEKFLNRAAQLGWLIMVTENRYFTLEAVLALADVAETLAAEADGGEFNPGAYRDRSGIGRNLTIEVLEFFDKTGFTRRTANQRRINAPAREIFAPSSKD
jgi:selenocysteine-specific elongation factor